MTTASSPLSKAALFARDIKLSHSIFALPFALLATFLAAAVDWQTVPGTSNTDSILLVRGRLPSAAELGLIVVCMVLARTMAMAINRWADAKLDAENPRTAGRAIPSGRLPAGFVLSAAIACGFGFIIAASGFWILRGNFWPLVLSPLVLAWLAAYSFTKRFTWLCHLILGAALAISPVAAAIAVNPAFLRHAEPYLFFAMVTCWVAGFDVIYALQDVEVDRRKGLFSMPSRLGVGPALAASRLLHAVALTALVMLARVSPNLGIAFRVGVGLVAALLFLEHAIVWKSKTHHIDLVFFTINGVISLLLGALGIFDVVRSLR